MKPTANGGKAGDPLGELIREARARLGGDAVVRCALTGQAYHLAVRRGGREASARLKSRFWEDYLASGRTDSCDCVDHFFEHLERQL